MQNEKMELLLNAALEATPQERAKSQELNVGYDAGNDTWEIIVKYHGSLLFLEEQSIVVEELLAGYAILTVPRDRLTYVSEIEQIEYVEIPKRLYFQIERGKRASCVLPVTIRPPYLSGEGVLIGVADSGIDFSLAAFRKADGSSKILAIWDQTLSPDEKRGWRSPAGFRQGVEFTQSQITEELQGERESGEYVMPGDTGLHNSNLPTRDISGHGTAVAQIASRVAPESELLIVKLGTPREDGFPRTTELMRAVTYLTKKAVELGRPIAINLSFGNTYGDHNGTSLLERFMDNVAEVGRSVICVGSGNEGAVGGHRSGRVTASGNGVTASGNGVTASGNGVTAGGNVSIGNERAYAVELSVGNYQGAFSVQLWKKYEDIYDIILISPGGDTSVISMGGQMQRLRMQETEVLAFVGEPTPYSVMQEIYFDFLPVDSYVNRGIWTFLFEPTQLVTGEFDMYLPSYAALSEETRFFRPTPGGTLTIPSTAAKVVTVGAYDAVYDAYADFSGRGFAGDIERRWTKPDIVAPGVGIVTDNGQVTGNSQVTGTSFATPFVTGAAALMMEWGIVQGNDIFLYGEKVKAYLRAGARPIQGEDVYPNERVGWGALCVAESIPRG